MLKNLKSLGLIIVVSTLAACPSPSTNIDPLPPPSASEGFQLKTVPVQVAAGQENQDCYFFRVPSASEAWVNHIVLRQRAGSHHLNIFRVKTIVNLSGEDGTVVKGGNDLKNPCWVSSNWADWPLVINSQSSVPGAETVDYTLPEGVAHKFAPGELLMLQTHYVNATTQVTPDVGEAWVNFEYYPTSKVTAELGTLFATNQNLKICPGESKFYEKTCRLPQPATIVAANGHFHSRGTRFSMFSWDEVAGKGGQFYDSSSWSDPVMATGLSVSVPQNGGVLYRCEFQAPSDSCGNPANGCCFTFGPQVETNEHCNAFVYYYPRINTDIPCF